MWAQGSSNLGLLIDLSWLLGGSENLWNISISTKSSFDGNMQEVCARTHSCEGLKKKKGKKIQIINWWEQFKNYRAPAIWSDHFRSAWAMGGNWIVKTSFIVDQLFCFKCLREDSDFLKALDICLKEHLSLWSLWFLAAWMWTMWFSNPPKPTECSTILFTSDTIYLDLVSDPTV